MDQQQCWRKRQASHGEGVAEQQSTYCLSNSAFDGLIMGKNQKNLQAVGFIHARVPGTTSIPNSPTQTRSEPNFKFAKTASGSLQERQHTAKTCKIACRSKTTQERGAGARGKEEGKEEGEGGGWGRGRGEGEGKMITSENGLWRAKSWRCSTLPGCSLVK